MVETYAERRPEEVVTFAQLIHVVALSLLCNPALQHGRCMGKALPASAWAPGRENAQLSDDAQAQLDSDEAFSQRSPMAMFSGDPPNSHLRLKTALLQARAAAALTRTGGVSAGASSTSMFGPRVGPTDPPMR